MPDYPKVFILSAPVKIDETIYVQNKNNKLFSFDINTKEWQMNDGMDIGTVDKYGGNDEENILNYIGTKYISSMEYD